MRTVPLLLCLLTAGSCPRPGPSPEAIKLVALALCVATCPTRSGPDSTESAAYTAVLQAIRQEHSAEPIILVLESSEAECLTHCSSSVSSTRHEAELIGRLADANLIDGTCSMPASELGCPEHNIRIVLALGPVRYENDHALITAVVVEPCTQTCPEAAGFRFRLRRRPGGEWEIVERRIEWIT
jgi:hypothetical protein